MVVANWSALSLIPEEQQEAHRRIISFLCCPQENNIAIAVFPVHSYKKNNLWLQEGGLLRSLSTLGVHVDKQFAINFNRKSVPPLVVL